MNERECWAERPSEIFDRLIVDIRERQEQSKFPLCVKELEEVCHGFTPGGVTMVSARTSHGKTAFMLYHAMEYAKQGKNVLYFGLEDGKARITERLLCQFLDFSNYNLRRGVIPEELDKTYLEPLDSLMIEDGSGFNLRELDLTYQKTIFKDSRRADIIFWDYIQMMEKGGLEVYTQFMRQCGPWVRQQKFPFVVGCQQNRWSVSKDGEVSLAGMKGAGALEEGSDMVLILNYPYQLGINPKKLEEEFKALSDSRLRWIEERENLKNEIWQRYFEISVAKQKDGMTKHSIPMMFEGAKYRFADWPGVIHFLP